MKNISIVIISILLICLSCNDDNERIPKPEMLLASNGKTVGCIRIELIKDPDASSIILERREKGTDDWQVITSTSLTSFDDNYGYSNVGMPPGKIFEYRIKNDGYDNAEYSYIEEGYAYDIIPVTEIDINSSLLWDNKTEKVLTWNEGNDTSFVNQSKILFDIYRSEDSLGTYEKIGQAGGERTYTDILPASLTGKKVYYRIDVYYDFEINLPTGYTQSEYTNSVMGTVTGTSSRAGRNPLVIYIITNLNLISSYTQNGISRILAKNINGNIYLGIINQARVDGIGIPELYLLNGKKWEKVWYTNSPKDFNEINYAIGSGSNFLAGIDDLLYVFEWNGSEWSDNLVPGNLAQVNNTSDVAIDVYNDNLYLAFTQYPDYKLQVLKYNASSWDTVGGDANGIIDIGNIWDLTLERIDDILYLHYINNNTLNVKHLNSTTWETDLTWSKDSIFNVDIAKSSTDLFFISGGNNSSYVSGVYKTTSSSTVEEVISNTTDEWFQSPLSLSIDLEDNLVVSSIFFESSEISYPFINIFDGTEWKMIYDDFSEGMVPATLISSGTDIIYVYGDTTNENANGYPTILRSKRMTK